MTSRRSNLGLLRLWAAEQLRLTLRAPRRSSSPSCSR